MDVSAPEQPVLSGAPTGVGPMAVYRQAVAEKRIVADPAQAAAVERLQALWSKLRHYDPPARLARKSLIGRFLRRKPVDEAPGSEINGLYLVGEVGRGKSMLMDMFFETSDVPRRRRIHFHAFMQETHARVFAWKQENPGGDDPIPPLADRIADEAILLCFDEFQINDIADAILLGRLFEALFERGVIVVATSNTVPDDLFRGQPGRDAFLPFIAVLKKHLDVLVLEAKQDYRRLRPSNDEDTWHVPPGPAAQAKLDAAFAELSRGAPVKPEQLHVMGRILAVPQAAAGIARFDFADLCARNLGAGDYLAIATHFQAVVLDDIPLLTPDNHNEARRFINLIDNLYDHRVKIIASAAAMPDQLYPSGDGAKAFERTASRLMEMRTEAYFELAHLT
ncbi:cell division protein ZapE [Acidisoma silvae]|uniref:AFG1 family ATPase n=1 Tax=Acidisoma silvae TaxID=2802396 RepID=A0A963YRD0_9PROT|nr:cell division protein ZapE [Acidisoma silvae]MCB8875554.1 AFG1 family ATPase [Acidisoma silvae]